MWYDRSGIQGEVGERVPRPSVVRVQRVYQ